MKTQKKILIFLLFLFFAFYTEAQGENLSDYDSFLGNSAAEIHTLEKELKNEGAQKLLLKIIKEASIKKVPAGQLLLFIKREKKNLLFIDEISLKYKIKDILLLDNVFFLIRNKFTIAQIEKILFNLTSDSFQEQLSKMIYFYLSYEDQIAIPFHQNEITEIALAVFRANPDEDYLKRLIGILSSLRDKKINTQKASQVLMKAVLKKKNPRQIEDLLKEIE